MSESSLQYDALVAFNLALARLRGGVTLADLSMHKRLLAGAEGRADIDGPSPPDKGGALAIDQWMAERVLTHSPQRVLDIGCGLGLTAGLIAENSACEVYGINANGAAVDFGTTFWTNRRASNTANLVQGHFDETLPVTHVDVMFSIEALGYAPDLDNTLTRLARDLAPEGVVLIIDDYLASDAMSYPQAAKRLCNHWHRPRLWRLAELLKAAESAGLSVTAQSNWTSRVPATRRIAGSVRKTVLEIAARFPGSPGAIASAFLGGWHLEELYAAGLAEYHFVAFKKGVTQ